MSINKKSQNNEALFQNEAPFFIVLFMYGRRQILKVVAVHIKKTDTKLFKFIEHFRSLEM